MGADSEFVDFYDLLEVDFHADARTLEMAFHRHAKMFHPDNSDTADSDRFENVVRAYKTLRDPGRRDAYNRDYAREFGRPPDPAGTAPAAMVDELTAAQDAAFHADILFRLYKQRRANASDPGMIAWLMQEKLGCTEAQFDFYVWYLKAKGLIEITEAGALAITIEGVEHVIALSRDTVQQQLLLGKRDES